MGGEGSPQGRLTQDFAARREAARARLDAIDPHKGNGDLDADPLRRDWFEAVYRLAEGDAACVPWGDLASHPLLADWLAREGSISGLRALDVGSGLGDNAEALAAAGARVSAFDLVDAAIDWAKRYCVSILARKERCVRVMDRGVPTEAVLAEMRASDPPVHYLVGAPEGRLTPLEKPLVDKPWREAREGVQVKLLAEDDGLYVFAQSDDRVAKERAMRKRQMKWLWKRLRQLAAMEVSREELLMKLGAARSKAPSAWRLVDIEIDKTSAAFTYRLNRKKLGKLRRREGRYLLRANLAETDPAMLWQYYIQLVVVEQAFKNLKDDLALRPIFHKEKRRIEAHIFVSFLA